MKYNTYFFCIFSLLLNEIKKNNNKKTKKCLIAKIKN